MEVINKSNSNWCHELHEPKGNELIDGEIRSKGRNLYDNKRSDSETYRDTQDKSTIKGDMDRAYVERYHL